MSRKRKTGDGLPKRVYPRGKAWYYFAPEKLRDPKDDKLKSWIPLAYFSEGLPAMLTALGSLLKDKRLDQGSMAHVCTEYKARKLSGYTEETRDQYAQYLDVIASDFEEFYFAQVTTKDWADFLRNHYSEKINTARKITALAGRVFRFGISEMGLRQDNPIDQIDLSDYKPERRTILPTHDQVRAIRGAGMHSKPRKKTGKVLPNPSGPMFQCLIDMEYLCWARAIDIRTLKEAQIDGDWIRIKPSKTTRTSGRAVDIFITPQIRAIIERARDVKRGYRVISPFLFPSRKGKAYTKSGLFSMWDRARDRLGIGKDSPPEERIQFRDLRALGATDAARAGENRKAIQDRLVHTSGKTTDIYIKEAVPEKSEIAMDLPWN